MTDITFGQVMEQAHAEGERIARAGLATNRATTDEPLAGLFASEVEQWTLDIDLRDGGVSVQQRIHPDDSVTMDVWEGHVSQFVLRPETSTAALVRMLREFPEAIARYATSNDTDELHDRQRELLDVLRGLDGYWMMDPEDWYRGHGLTGRETDAEIEDLATDLVAQDDDSFLWAAFDEDEARAWLKERVSELACA